ncbi:MAG: hypothetical protein ACP5NG_03715 [Conexivisphaera sp.]
MSEGESEQEKEYLAVTDQKPISAYVISGEVQLKASGRLVLMARGRSISYAVDVANQIVERSEGTASISGVRVATDRLPDGKYISRMEITIERRGGAAESK